MLASTTGQERDYVEFGALYAATGWRRIAAMLHELAALWPSYIAYALTFLFIGQVWANHHVMFDHIRVVDRVMLLLNTLLLMIVAFLPFATSVLAGALRNGHSIRTAVVFTAWHSTPQP